MLNAYVFPHLRGQGWTLVEARGWQDPEAALRKALAPLPGERRRREDASTPLRGLIEAAARRADGKLLLVFDQFEEFLILADSAAQAAFAGLLADLQARPIAGMQLLLVLRSDYHAALEDAGLPMLRQGDNWCQVGRFTLAAARKFMADSALGLQTEALETVLTSAVDMDDSPGLIRPITLNVIGHVLSEGALSAPSLDAGKLVQRYIGQAVEQPAIRDYARPVLEQLLTVQGSKRPRGEQELAAAGRLRRSEVRAVLNGLAHAALARPLDAAQGVWELSHDFIARAIAGYLGQRRRVSWRPCWRRLRYTTWRWRSRRWSGAAPFTGKRTGCASSRANFAWAPAPAAMRRGIAAK